MSKRRNSKTRKKHSKNIRKRTFKDKIVQSKSYLFIVAIFLGFSFIIDIYYQPIQDIIKGSDRIELHFGRNLDNDIKFKLKESDNTYLFYTTPKEYNIDSNVFVPITLEVHNKSQEPDKDIMVSFKYKYINRPEPFINLPQKSFGSRLSSDIIHETNTNQQYTLSNYKINFLPKNGLLTLTDGGITTNKNYEEFHDKVLLTTGKGVNLEVITYSQSDSTRSYKLFFNGVNVNNKKSLNYWIKRFYSSFIAHKERETNDFWTYLYNICVSKEIVFYGIDFQYEEHQKINSLFIPNEINGYMAYVAKPYKWELLFTNENSLGAKFIRFLIEK